MPNVSKITVITPSYNQGKFIERTISSVLSQNYPNLEYIVVDGGSTDGTIDTLKKYGKQLKWLSEKDNGQTDAINKGIRMSTGDIIAYLNSDDVYEPRALERVAEAFSSNPSAMWLTGRCRIIDKFDREMRSFITLYKNCLLRHYSHTLLLITNPISQPATFWRRDIVREFGLFDENERFTMDYEYWLRIGSKYTPAVIDDYLAGFRVYRESKTSSSFYKSFKSELAVSKKYSNSKLIHAAHALSAYGICAAYSMLQAASYIKKRFFAA